MSTLSKNLRNLKSLGGAAAAVLSAAGAIRAQAAAAPRRDSTVTERVILPGRMDSIAFIAGRIIQERPGSTMWITLTSQLDSFLVNSVSKRVFLRGGVVPPSLLRSSPAAAKGWLGFVAQGPVLAMSDSSGTRYRFFAYQPIISVDPGSPADRAGIVPGDLLVAYNGVDLFNHDFDLNDILVPRKRVDITVRRDGETKNFTLVAAAVPEDVARRRVEMDRVANIELKLGRGMMIAGDGDGGFGGSGERPMTVGAFGSGGSVVAAAGASARAPMAQGAGFGTSVRAVPIPPQKMIFIAPHGLFGANLSNMSDELARVLKLRKGVLVNEVPEDTPAYRAGLRTGDVIITAENDSVATVGALQDVVFRHAAEHSTDLQIVRLEKGQQKIKKLTISWPD